MVRKKRKVRDVFETFDRTMELDVPFSQLNKRGRKLKRKSLLNE